MQRPPRRSCLAARYRRALGALTLALALPGAARPAEGFYADLLRDGQRAYQRGDFAAAARDLRIACFGLLEEPELLMQGLVELALAQAGSGDAEGFQQTFDRLLEVEERFAVYRSAPVPDTLRATFEQQAAQRVSAATLRASPTFAHLTTAAGDGPAAAVSPARRRKQLEARLAAEPGNQEHRLQLAELELEQGRSRRAASHLDDILAAEPRNEAARCLRGRVAARTRDCRRAVVDLAACGPPAGSVLAAERLGCLVRLERWQEADDLLAALPESVRADPEIAGLEQRVGAGLPVVASGPAAGESVAASPPPDDPGAAVAELQRRLGDIAGSDQLASLLDDARRLAAEHPDSHATQFVAAEIAYRASSWSDVVAFLERAGGPPPNDGALQFYLAVSLYETGRPQAAAEPMRRALGAIERNSFVESYARKILGADAGTR